MRGEEQKKPTDKGSWNSEEVCGLQWEARALFLNIPVEVACFDRYFIIQTFIVPRLTASLDDRRTSSSCQLHSVLGDSLQLVLGSFRQIYHQQRINQQKWRSKPKKRKKAHFSLISAGRLHLSLSQHELSVYQAGRVVSTYIAQFLRQFIERIFLAL